MAEGRRFARNMLTVGVQEGIFVIAAGRLQRRPITAEHGRAQRHSAGLAGNAASSEVPEEGGGTLGEEGNMARDQVGMKKLPTAQATSLTLLMGAWVD
jgi:hypothetical protein